MAYTSVRTIYNATLVATKIVQMQHEIIRATCAGKI